MDNILTNNKEFSSCSISFMFVSALGSSNLILPEKQKLGFDDFVVVKKGYLFKFDSVKVQQIWSSRVIIIFL